MKEIRDIIESYDTLKQTGRQSALATVVHVEGSSYRRPGARMLIADDGGLTGAISGGCLEGDALRKALLVMHEKKAKLVTYDTMDDDDAKFGVGLGCNGIIQVLIEPVDASDPHNPIALLKEADKKRQNAVLVSLFNLQDKMSPQTGTCLLFRADEPVIGRLPVLQDQLMEDIRKSLVNRQSSFKNFREGNNEISAFIELIKPPVSLVIAGAGNDVIPVVEMAGILGWETTVVDGRPNYARADRFADGCQLVIARPEEALEKILIDELTCFLLMTHNYNYDKGLLRELLLKDVSYIGMLGPKKKKDRMLSELSEDGYKYTTEQLSVLHSPVGLDIGAETPEEIALSIIAEIKSIFSSKSAESLRERERPIHQ